MHSLKIPNFGHAEDNSENTPQDTFEENSLHNDKIYMVESI